MGNCTYVFDRRLARIGWAILLSAIIGVYPGWAQEAVSTQVMVRVRAHDAKLLQDPVGGARITIRNADTGDILAQGLQKGSSGSTEAIMRQPHERGADIYDTAGAAGYLATLKLDHPVHIRITAEGPLDYPQAMQEASTTMWLVPGEDVLGNGVVLTVHGFIVEIVSPNDASAAEPGQELAVRARVRMLCGCPTEPGGMWDSSRYTIQAQLIRDGTVVHEAPLQFAGTTNHYNGTLAVPERGADHLRVTVADPGRANFGVATMKLTASSSME